MAAIEDEDWHVIGAPVYVRGFMRTYARFLGLDPEAAVARFSSSVPAGTPAATTVRATPEAREKRSGEQSSPSLAAILAIVVAICAVLFVGYEFYQYRSAAPAAPLAQGSAPAGAAAADGSLAAAPDAGASSIPVEGAPAPIAAALPGPKAAVKRGLSVHVTETSWLRVAVDGSVVFEGTLPAGTTKSYNGKSAVVRVGNAGGVQVAINGKPMPSLGAFGDVVERRFVLSGE